ncbi:MAG: InlB B-repeat-containing protein [Spirochaetales bacterium]|nr:InlB B-repeat-containing protein [Spirochaetales bacterium]
MKNFYHLIFSLFVLSTLVLSGCTTYSAGSNNDGATVSFEEKSSDMGFIISFGSQGRGAYYTIDEVSYFNVRVSLGSNVVAEKTATFSDTVKIGLTKEGLYTIAITAYNSKNDPIADGSTQKQLYYDSGYQRVSIAITPYSKSIDIIVDVQWVQPEDTSDGYTITYNLNGGENHSSNPSVFTEDDYIYLQSPTYAGYKFCGWYENEDCSGYSIDCIYGNERNANVELWAKWEETAFVPFPAEAVVSSNGVYTATLVKEGFTDGWCGGDDIDYLKVVLAPRDVVAKMITGEIASESELFTDENMCYVYANNNVGNGKITIANLSTDTYLQPVGTNGTEYTGLAVRTDAEGNYVVLFDITKINKDILLAKSNMESNDDVWENKGNIESDYIPMVLGCVTGDYSCYPFQMWNVGVAVLEPTDEVFPETLNKETLPTANEVKYISGSLTDWNYAELTNNTYEFTFSGDILNYCYNDYLEFLFYTDDQTVRIGGGTFTSLDENVELTNSYNYVRLPISLLNEGTKYLITFTATGDYTATVSVCPTESF